MKLAPIVFTAAALAPAFASADYLRYDAVTGSYIRYSDPMPPVEIVTVPASTVVYEERVVPRETIVVESAPAYRYPADELLLKPGYPDLSGYPDRISAMNPQTGQLIGYGLFNRAGPNDFGGGSGNG